jgi:hypothetical protein
MCATINPGGLISGKHCTISKSILHNHTVIHSFVPVRQGPRSHVAGNIEYHVLECSVVFIVHVGFN